MAATSRGILQEVQPENDENLLPGNIQDRPTDDDRARFGFKPKMSQKSQKDSGSDGQRSSGVPPTATTSSGPLVDLQTVLRRTIGDPDDVLPVLRLKPTAGKYEFKDKIADLQAMIGPLKNALSDQRLKAKALVEALLSMEPCLDQRLRSSIEEVTTLKSELKEAHETLASTQRDVALLRAEQPRWRENAELSKRREDAMQEKLSEALSRASRLDRDLDEARRIARSFSDDATKYKRKCEEMGEKHKMQMEEAAELLRKQVDETIQAQAQLAEAHQKKEAALIAEFDKNRETLKKEQKHQLHELQQMLRRKETEMKAEIEELKENYTKMLQEKDLLLESKESEMKIIMEDKEIAIEQQENKHRRYMDELKKKHEVDLKEMSLLHQQQEEKMTLCHQELKQNHNDAMQQKEHMMSERMDALEKKYQGQLEEAASKHGEKESVLQMELKRKDVEMQDRLKTLEENHQRSMDELQSSHRLKDVKMQDRMKTLEENHQRSMDELQNSHRLKDVEMQDRLKTLEENHQRSMDELQNSHRLKEATAAQAAADSAQAFRREETSLRDLIQSLQKQLSEKEANLRESFQSMQLLQNNSSDQLRFEQQRVQKLEREAEELRSRHQVHLQRLEQSDAELSTTRQQVSELRQSLQRLEMEKEQQSEKASERQAALQEQIIQLKIQSKSFEEEANTLRTTLEVRQGQCEKLTVERDALEVEFRSYKDHHGTSNQQQMEAITDLRLTVDKLSKQVDFTKAELQVQQGNLSQRQGYMISLENQLAQAELTRRELHNIIQELKGNIRVFCRVRPQHTDTLTPLQMTENKIALEHLGESYNFNFDRVFDGSSTQEAIFDEVSGLVQSALDGYKVCIFAYGQTGSGKTFTMQGSENSATRGLIPRCLLKILQSSETMRAAGWEWTLKVSFLEVYNEVLRDLLDTDGHQLVHVIKHDEAYGTMVTNVTAIEVKQMDHINRLMEKAAKARAVGATDMNATSSRSHSIFAMYLHGVNRELNSELTGALHLVDLAGSERLDKSGSTGDRLKETQNINKSLSSLADVFMAKAEGRSHIPFRNSKLTHLMEPCLNGQGKTLMVVNVGPEAEFAHETLCSLRFASQVSQCNTGGKPKRCVRAAPTGNRQAPSTTRRGK